MFSKRKIVAFTVLHFHSIHAFSHVTFKSRVWDVSFLHAGYLQMIW